MAVSIIIDPRDLQAIVNALHVEKVRTLVEVVDGGEKFVLRDLGGFQITTVDKSPVQSDLE